MAKSLQQQIKDIRGIWEKPPRYINMAWLEEKSACSSGQLNFRRVFPRGSARLTYESLVKAAKAGLDLDWFIDIIFSYAAKNLISEKAKPFSDKAIERKRRIREKYPEFGDDRRYKARQKVDTYLRVQRAKIVARALGLKPKVKVAA